MRKLLFSLLLATTVATPALADRPGHHDSSQSRDDSRSDHNQARPDRSEVHQDRSDARQDRSANRAEARANVQARAGDDVRFQGGARMNSGNEQAAARQQMGFRDRDSANVNERGRPTLDNRDRSNAVAEWQNRQRERSQADQAQNQRRQWQGQRYDRRDVNQQRIEQQNQRRSYANNDGHRSNWDSNWRHDRRYDWRDYRNRHRSTFHLGLYYDPFGWGYQRYNVGFNLRPNYYGSNYWLNDPSMYALPYAPFPFRWVRYYNDAILVNTYTGQVADVIYDFFW
jgi:hypothetical protein